MKVKASDIYVEKIRHNGALIVSTIVGELYVHKTFYGYNKREAVKLFRDELNKGEK